MTGPAQNLAMTEPVPWCPKNSPRNQIDRHWVKEVVEEEWVFSRVLAREFFGQEGQGSVRVRVEEGEGQGY